MTAILSLTAGGLCLGGALLHQKAVFGILGLYWGLFGAVWLVRYNRANCETTLTLTPESISRRFKFKTGRQKTDEPVQASEIGSLVLARSLGQDVNKEQSNRVAREIAESRGEYAEPGGGEVFTTWAPALRMKDSRVLCFDQFTRNREHAEKRLEQAEELLDRKREEKIWEQRVENLWSSPSSLAVDAAGVIFSLLPLLYFSLFATPQG